MFLKNFLLWNEGNEVPNEYLLWSAYGALSVAVGRRMHFDYWGQFNVMPNVYILLLGKTGNRKTAGMDKAVDLLYDAIPDVVISAECETHQGILKYMDAPGQIRTFIDPEGTQVEFHPYALFASELMDYLAINPIGMINFLTNIYDRWKGYTYRLRGGDQFLPKPYFVMCSCTTDDWLTEQINAKTFSQGYGRRSIIISGQEFTRKKCFYNTEHEKARLYCVDWLRQLNALKGGVAVMTPEAEAFYWKWYLGQKPKDDKFVEAWASSKNINVVKVAMLTSASERLDKIITLGHVEMALTLLDEVENNLHKVTDRMGRSELIAPTQAIFDYLRVHAGAVPEKELQAKMSRHFKNSVEYYHALQSLVQTDQVSKVPITKDTVKRIYICLPGTFEKG